MKTFLLSNNLEIPAIGFGTWQTPDGDVAEASVLTALKAGYRHIDTAAVYRNEESVGRAVKKSGIDRSELFITTKLWNDAHSYEGAKQAINDSLKRLQLDYFDLYLIHWPNPLSHRHDWAFANSEAWRAMEEAYEAGIIKAIGVSNFHPRHLTELFKTAKVKPMVNQILFNPSDTQDDVVAFNKEHNILTQAYSPLGTGKIFEIKELAEIAEKYQKTVAQVVIRWVLDQGCLPLPKSVTESRIIENIDVFDFELSQEDSERIHNFKGKAGLAKNPDEVDY